MYLETISMRKKKPDIVFLSLRMFPSPYVAAFEGTVKKTVLPGSDTDSVDEARRKHGEQQTANNCKKTGQPHQTGSGCKTRGKENTHWRLTHVNYLPTQDHFSLWSTSNYRLHVAINKTYAALILCQLLFTVDSRYKAKTPTENIFPPNISLCLI